MPARFLSLDDVAEELAISRSQAYALVRNGNLPAMKVGGRGQWRVERSQLLAWLEEHSNQRDSIDRWFDKTGRLRSIPARRGVRRQVLERMVVDLKRDRTYREAELNEVLGRYHDDVAALRREMVAERLLVRTPRGIYKLAAAR